MNSEIKTNKDTGSPSYYLGRLVKEQKTFEVKGTFKSVYAAQSWIEEKGYSEGSMCGPMPIALQKGLIYDLPEKWKNMDDQDKEAIDGVMISQDFREGAVTVILF